MRSPTVSELERMATELGLAVAADELGDVRELVENRLAPLERIEREPEPRTPPHTYTFTDRDPGYAPANSEDPNNAWIRRCEIDGADEGPLAGMTVGLKDNISVGGVPLTNGSRVMDGFVPAVDATIVSRLLEDGATIAGKNNMWSFSLGPSDHGTVTNPAYPAYSISGSSSGTAAAVASGDVDIGIGGDQGGSIRIPSAFGGLVGVKPTHGLVPYTGILGADPSIDHTGPITRDVRTAALALETVAGRDQLDARQPDHITPADYTDALDEDVAGMTVGLLDEGFDVPNHDRGVIETVHESVRDFEGRDVDVTTVSVPTHPLASDVTLSIVRYGYGQLLHQHGVPIGLDGWYDTGAAAYLSRALRARAGELPVSMQSSMLLAEHIRRHCDAGVYGKAQNLARAIAADYDEALADIDALVMPTVPIKPPAAGQERTLQTMLQQEGGSNLAANTLPFNATGHPAITVPCGEHDGAPVGMTLVGDRFDESTLFRLADGFERFS